MKSYLAQGLLLGAVVAAPNEAVRRAACNADNCSRAIFGTKTLGANARGSAACSSFLRTTVSPCTVTATATATSTTTLSTTVSTTLDVTSTTTTTTTPVITTTITVPTTVTPTSTETDTSTVTVFTTEFDQSPLKKRATTSCPATTTPSAIPTFYSACSGAVRFSSACSCAGIRPTTTVLPTSTSTTTTTQTVSVTNTATSTITSDFTVTATETDTSTVSETTTATITADPVTTTVTATTTTTETVATSTAYVPQCDNSNPNTLGTGGCSSNCYCDTAYNGGTTNIGVCNDSIACGRRCNSGLDCPFGQSCIMDSSTGPCGGPTCVDTTGCSSSFNPPSKRDIAVSVGGTVDVGAMSPAPGAAFLSRPF